MLSDMIGWAAAVVLAMTISRQVYTQWKTGSVAGVSKWLFVGQLSASVGFTIYSWLVENRVFVATNAFMALTAVVGEAIYLRNRRRAQHTQSGAHTGKREPVREPVQEGRAAPAVSRTRAVQR